MKKNIEIIFVDKEKIFPNYGRTKIFPNYARIMIRNDLSNIVTKSVLKHEQIHANRLLKGEDTENILWEEIIANWESFKFFPLGWIICLLSTMTDKDRLIWYLNKYLLNKK